MADGLTLPYHLAQLRALCEAHPVALKVVFVPTRLVGHSIGAALAAAGVSWANLHLTTVQDWAEREVGPSLTAVGWKPLGADAALVRIQEIIRTIEPRPGAPVDALARAAHRTIGALRMAGIDGEHLTSLDGISEVTRFAAAVHTEYEQWLTEKKLYDNAYLLQKATERAQNFERPQVAIFDEVLLTGRERFYVEVLSGGAPVCIGVDSYGVESPHLSAARFFAPVTARTPQGATGCGLGLWQNGSVPGAGTLVAREAFSPSCELQEVLRTLQTEGIPLDQAEVVYSSEEPYLSLAWAFFERHGLPATFAGGVPVLRTRPGVALKKWLEWVGSNYDCGQLVDLLASRTMRLSGGPDPCEAASLLRKAKIGRGRQRYLEVLHRIHTSDANAVDEDEPRWSGHDRYVAGSLLIEIEKLFRLVPDRSTVWLRDLVQGCIHFLDAFAVTLTTEGEVSLDEKAREAISQRLRELSAQSEGPWPLDEAVRYVASIIATHRVSAGVPRSGKLHVAPLEAGGYSGRPYVFMIGLDQRAFPGSVSEDPLLLDAERGRLGLPLIRSSAGERNWHLVRMLAMQCGTVYLSAARFDDAGDQRCYASAAFLQAVRLAGLSAQAPVSRLPVAPPADMRDLDGFACRLLDETEAALSVRRMPGLQEKLLGDFPALKDGLDGEEARKCTQWTPFDGVLEAGLDLSEKTLSASALEDLVTCPYSYFLKRILQATPVEQIQDEEDEEWLGAVGQGSLLHRVFRQFLDSLRLRGEKPDRFLHEAELMQMLDEAVEIELGRSALPNQAAADREVDRMKRAARIFLAAESEYLQDAEPIGFEVAFGFPDAVSPGQPDPVTLDLGGVRVRLRGRIDRIDAHPDGTLGIWDYKTGGAKKYTGADLLKVNKLQWALYALALKQITGKEVSTSGYFFTSEREWGRRIGQCPVEPSDLGAILEPTFLSAQDGRFIPKINKDICKYCDYKCICGDTSERERQLKGKASDQNPGEVQ